MGADFKPPTNVSKSQLGAMGITITGGAGGVAASIALRGAPLVLPKLGAVAAPVVIAGAAGAPFAIVTSQYLKEVYDNGLARERDKIMPLPVPPNLTMEDHGDAPPLTARPTDTAERPKPKVTDLPNAPTDLVPTSNAKPEAKAQPQAKPETTVENLPQPYTPDAPQGTPPQQQPPRLNPKDIAKAIGAAAAGTVAGVKGKEAIDSVQNNDQPGTYTTKITWGRGNIPARPYGKGYWGQRTQQNDARVDAYELKINPNNESYYIKHPDGRFVQFENIDANAVQDGKLIKQVNNSIYRVYDKPAFLRENILNEAKKQAEAAAHNGLQVEWLVSDEETIKQLQEFFKENNLDIKLTYLPE